MVEFNTPSISFNNVLDDSDSNLSFSLFTASFKFDDLTLLVIDFNEGISTLFYYYYFFPDPIYRPNQAAPTPVMTDINAVCSGVGADNDINHMIDLYNKIIYVDMNILGNILKESIASDNLIILFDKFIIMNFLPYILFFLVLLNIQIIVIHIYLFHTESYYLTQSMNIYDIALMQNLFCNDQVVYHDIDLYEKISYSC